MKNQIIFQSILFGGAVVGAVFLTRRLLSDKEGKSSFNGVIQKFREPVWVVG